MDLSLVRSFDCQISSLSSQVTLSLSYSDELLDELAGSFVSINFAERLHCRCQ